MKVAIFLNNGKKSSVFYGADKVICADGGLSYCPVKPDLLVGDFDSLAVVPNDIKVIRHNPRKNDTDGTLALRIAVDEFDADEVDIYGTLGGRQDHVLGNLSLLALGHSLGAKVVAREQDLDIHFATGKISLPAYKNSLVSIIPWGGNATVTNSKGLDYPLENLTLTSLDTRGISNVATDDTISFDVIKGAVLVFVYK